jgi:hypothetical protein
MGDEIQLKEQLPLDQKLFNEGLYTLAWAGPCRGKVSTLIYDNESTIH